MCGEHGLDISDQVFLLQELPEGVADRVDLLSVVGTAESASVVGNGTELAELTLYAPRDPDPGIELEQNLPHYVWSV
jgi:hypothetical protein